MNRKKSFIFKFLFLVVFFIGYQSLATANADTDKLFSEAQSEESARVTADLKPAKNITDSTFFALKSLGDINGDSDQDSAVVNKASVSVRKLNSLLLNEFAFSSNPNLVDVELMQDINNNGAPEMVLLGVEPARAEVIDSLTGEILGATTFSAEFTPVDMELIPDQNGDFIPELAVLEKKDGTVRVEIRDFLNDALVKNIYFNHEPRPIGLKVFQYENMTNLAVLQDFVNPEKFDRVEIKDLATKKRLRLMFIGKGSAIKQFVVLTHPNIGKALAVLREGSTTVLMVSIRTVPSESFRYIRFNSNFIAQKLLVVPISEGGQEIGILVRHPLTNQVRIELETGKKLWYGRNDEPLDAVAYPDINGNGSPEIGVLGRNDIDQSLIRLRIKDSKTGAHLKTVKY